MHSERGLINGAQRGRQNMKRCRDQKGEERSGDWVEFIPDLEIAVNVWWIWVFHSQRIEGVFAKSLSSSQERPGRASNSNFSQPHSETFFPTSTFWKAIHSSKWLLYNIQTYCQHIQYWFIAVHWTNAWVRDRRRENGVTFWDTSISIWKQNDQAAAAMSPTVLQGRQGWNSSFVVNFELLLMQLLQHLHIFHFKTAHWLSL